MAQKSRLRKPIPGGLKPALKPTVVTATDNSVPSSSTKSTPTSQMKTATLTPKKRVCMKLTKEKSTPRSSSPDSDFPACEFCGRHFAPDRIEKHVQFSQGSVAKQLSNEGATGPCKSGWREKHETFLETIRQAKVVQQHVAAGGKASDLPPPPPMDTSDYIQCPHCRRRFNESVAARHVPKLKAQPLSTSGVEEMQCDDLNATIYDTPASPDPPAGPATNRECPARTPAIKRQIPDYPESPDPPAPCPRIKPLALKRLKYDHPCDYETTSDLTSRNTNWDCFQTQKITLPEYHAKLTPLEQAESQIKIDFEHAEEDEEYESSQNEIPYSPEKFYASSPTKFCGAAGNKNPISWVPYGDDGKIFPHPKFQKRILLEYEDFVVCYDLAKRAPCWTLEMVNGAFGNVYDENDPKIPNEEEDMIPKKFRTCHEDYVHRMKINNIRIQHLAEFYLSCDNNLDMCVCSNLVAQRVGLHPYDGNLWDELRLYIQALLTQYVHIYILTGTLYLPKRRSDGKWTVKYKVFPGSDIAIPTHFFKVLLCEHQNGKFRLECYRFENKVHKNLDLRQFIVKIEDLERETGFKIFKDVEVKQIRRREMDKNYASSGFNSALCTLPKSQVFPHRLMTYFRLFNLTATSTGLIGYLAATFIRKYSQNLMKVNAQPSSPDESSIEEDNWEDYSQQRAKRLRMSTSSEEEDPEFSNFAKRPPKSGTPHPSKRARMDTLPQPGKSETLLDASDPESPLDIPDSTSVKPKPQTGDPKKEIPYNATAKHLAIITLLQKLGPPAATGQFGVPSDDTVTEDSGTQTEFKGPKSESGKNILSYSHINIPKMSKRFVIDNDDFVIYYDNNTRAPCWTLQEVVSKKLSTERTMNIGSDKEQEEVPEDFRTGMADYKHDEYKMQHVAEPDLHPGSYRHYCVFSNMVLQKIENGDKCATTVWDELRAYVAYLSMKFKSVYVLSGPLYLPNKDKDGKMTIKYELIGEKSVAVPTHFFKVILCQQYWDKHFRFECYKFENKYHEKVDLRKFIVNRHQLEKDAGFLIFSKVEDKLIAYFDTDRTFATKRYYKPRRLDFEDMAVSPAASNSDID
uniref:C2HC/C3H-type domain-containing protein n=1 Tax=Strigamia maritima TaxID=126957 RepID=T1J361_STRMM